MKAQDPKILALVLALLAVGCIVESKRPFHFPDEALRLEGLASVWKETEPAGGESTASVELVERGHGYDLLPKDLADEKLSLTLFRLEGEIFADVVAGDPKALASRKIRHRVSRLKLTSDRLELTHLDMSCLERGLTSKALGASYKQKEKGDEILLTGSTAELKGVLVWALAHGCFEVEGNKQSFARPATNPTLEEIKR